MEYKAPESSYIIPSHKIEGPMNIAKKSFYELAKSRIKYLNTEEFSSWFKKVTKKQFSLRGSTGAFIFLWPKHKKDREGNLKKWIDNLEIAVNKDVFNINGEDYQDIMPFIIEHEIYEGWLSAKKGWGHGQYEKEDLHKKHLLALRREFLLAYQKGLADKLLKWRIKMDPSGEYDYKKALKNAKIKSSNLQNKRD